MWRPPGGSPSKQLWRGRESFAEGPWPSEGGQRLAGGGGGWEAKKGPEASEGPDFPGPAGHPQNWAASGPRGAAEGLKESLAQTCTQARPAVPGWCSGRGQGRRGQDGEETLGPQCRAGPPVGTV